MTSEQWYAPAEKRIAEIKAKGRDPYGRAKDLIRAAHLSDGKVKINLKNLYDKTDVFHLTLEENAWGDFELHYDNGVLCGKLPRATQEKTAERLTLELLAMSAHMDLTWKQFDISTARARGLDV